MWHDGCPPPLEPPVTACHSEGGKKARRILETAHDDPFSRNTPEELTSALSPAVRDVAAEGCYTVVEL